MQLSKTHIQKINNFLEAMEIEYIDIRLEMIDHIATEIEQNFTNIPAFFDGRGFHIPFVKFMMSKKNSIIKEYKTQVKRKKSLHFNMASSNMTLTFLLFNILSMFIKKDGFFDISTVTKEIILSLFISLHIVFVYSGLKVYQTVENEVKKMYNELQKL